MVLRVPEVPMVPEVLFWGSRVLEVPEGFTPFWRREPFEPIPSEPENL
jgi:hypothetical protein